MVYVAVRAICLYCLFLRRNLIQSFIHEYWFWPFSSFEGVWYIAEHISSDCPRRAIHMSTSVSYHTLVTGSLFLTLSFLLTTLFIAVIFSSSLPAVKMDKMHPKPDTPAKPAQAPSAPATTSSSSTSSSSTTVSSNTTAITTSSSALKAGLNCPSIPKPPLLAPGQIPNGKGHLTVLSEKKQDSSSASSRRHVNKKVTGQLECGMRGD